MLYPQHDALALLPADAMSDRDLAAHLVHDHGADAVWLNDMDGVAFTVTDPTTFGDDKATVDRENERAVAFLAADRTLALDLHAIDHDTDDGVARVVLDEYTATWNDHRHHRSARSFALAVVASAGTHGTYAEDPGGFLSYVVSTEDDPDDSTDAGRADLDLVVTAAAALLEHDALWIE